jgi:hypothetical protein
MSVSVIQFQNYVGTKEEGPFVDQVLTSARLMVGNYIGQVSVPSTIVDQAVLTVASELFHRRSAPNGIAQFASMDGSPVRVAKDPMNSVYPLLMPFLKPGI